MTSHSKHNFIVNKQARNAINIF
ncbi:protein of unknown function [Pararobbsia alpina]